MQTSAYEHFNDTHLHMVGMQTLHTKCCGAVLVVTVQGSDGSDGVSSVLIPNRLLT